MAIPNSVLYYGRDELPNVQRTVRAGPLTMLYDGGDLRYIRWGDREIIRRIYVAVRDQNWGTPPAALSNVAMEIASDSFEIRYDATHKQGDIEFIWKGVIQGTSSGALSFSMHGEAQTSFLRSRIGFCILHPMACAGVPARIEHVDGTIELADFPTTIAPQLVRDGHPCPVSPFENMHALAHRVTPELWARVQFSGEIFEMEDQRNWTDASFKTYGTPLALPFPIQIEAGTKVEQTVTLSLEGALAPTAPIPVSHEVTLSIDSQRTTPLPQLGLDMASHGEALSRAEIDRLRELHLSHLRVDLALDSPKTTARLEQAATQAQSLDLELEVALLLTDDAAKELTHLGALLDEIRPRICRWLIFHKGERTTSARWLDLARVQLSAYAPAARFGLGSNAYFTDLNALRPDPENADFITYSINPQVHAVDHRSLVETLAAQAVTVESARILAAGKGVVVSPVTLLPRFNPNATGPEADPQGELPPQVDVRQMSLLGAGWTVGSLKYLGSSDIESVTYFETIGWRGVMERATGSPLPQLFPSQPGMLFPLYHVLADIGEFAGGELLALTSNRPLAVDGLTMRAGGRLMTLIANLSAEEQRVTIHTRPGRWSMRTLDATTAEQAMLAPDLFRRDAIEMIASSAGRLELLLQPYAVVRIDGKE